MSQGQTNLLRLAACLGEPPQELCSKLHDVANRIASKMNPPGRVVEGQDFEVMVENIAQVALDFCGRTDPDPRRSDKVLANVFYAQGRDLAWPPRRFETSKGIRRLAAGYLAAAWHADQDVGGIRPEVFQRMTDRIRKR